MKGNGGQVLAEISNGIVQLLSAKVGRGPTRCRTHWAGEDVLVVVVGDPYTEAEITLFEDGRGEAALLVRRELQQALNDPMRELVEETTGRKVEAFMSANHRDPDYGVEVFVLASE